MASEIGKKDQSVPQTDTGVRRRGLLRFGTLMAAFTGASAAAALGASSAQAAPVPGDKYVPIAEKGAPSGVAALDSVAKILPSQLPDLSATYVPKWKANTAYLAGDKVLSTAGDVVSAKVNFTSGASYSADNWDLSPTYTTPAVQATAITAATAPVNTRNPITGVFNVKAYGATGNGTTTDTGSIGAARDAAGVNGTLYFPPGTYIVDGLNATVAGQTWNLHPEAVLKQKNAASTLYALRITGNGTTLIGGTLDGNNTNQTGGNMFQIRNGATDIKVRGTIVKNAYGYGLAISGSTRVSIQDCTFLNCISGVGQAFYDATYGVCTDIDFSNNYVDMRAVALGVANTGGFTSFGNSTNHNVRISFNNNRIFVNKDPAGTNTGCLGVLYTDGGTVNNNVCVGSTIPISIAGNSKRITVNGNEISGFYSYGLEFDNVTDCSGGGNMIDATGAARFALSVSGTAARITLSGGQYIGNNTTQQVINLASGIIDTTINGGVVNAPGAGQCGIIANSSGRFTVNGTTFLGNGVADSAIKTINSAGEFTVSGGTRFRDFVTAGVRIDATSSTTTNDVLITGTLRKNTPATHVVMGLATLGANALTTGNL